MSYCETAGCRIWHSREDEVERSKAVASGIAVIKVKEATYDGNDSVSLPKGDDNLR